MSNERLLEIMGIGSVEPLEFTFLQATQQTLAATIANPNTMPTQAFDATIR